MVAFFLIACENINMKKDSILTLSSFSLTAIVISCCALYFAHKSEAVTKADLVLNRYNITMDYRNRKNVRFVADSGDQGNYYFDLVGTTPKGNEYSSGLNACYVATSDKNRVNLASNDYICRFSSAEIIPYHDVLMLGFSARSDVKIGGTQIDPYPDNPVVTIEVGYNDSVEHETLTLSMNYDLGYATGEYSLTDEHQAITFYSVSINYSCSY